jgi:thiol:disulfide interchange protein DsbD
MEIDRSKFITLALLALLAFFIYRHLHPSATLAADGAGDNWDAAVADARSAHRPVVVLFTAGWCPACQALHVNTLSRDEIRNELRDHYTFCRVDLTNPPPTIRARAEKYGVHAIPTLIRFDVSGQETARAHYLAPAEMLRWLRAGE